MHYIEFIGLVNLKVREKQHHLLQLPQWNYRKALENGMRDVEVFIKARCWS
jgi:hypothetical protein